MNILIAGASGLIGTELVKELSKDHQITVLGRNLKKLEAVFPNTIQKLTWDHLKTHDAATYDLIINLSGSNIGSKRWTPAIKKELIESRTLTNEKLIHWLLEQHAKPRFFCANAIGIYGAKESNGETFDEDSLIPETSHDFLQTVGIAWEHSLKPAIDNGIPVTTLRFGVVLKKGDGMLKKLELPFNLGMGSILGDGHQMLSWIHYQDLINAVRFLIEHPNVTGPVNITTPSPISQKEFAHQFAKTLKRPLFLKMPAWTVKILFGEMGECLLLKGQKVFPKRLTDLGFKFTYPTIEATLKNQYQNHHN